MERLLPHILDLTRSQLQQLVISCGVPSYRADQLLVWIYKKLAASYTDMTDLPLSFRQKLAAETTLFTLRPLEEKVSNDSLTRKILFQLDDQKTIETTLMEYEKRDSSRERRTVCVSSQVGCQVGCSFCATGQQGFERNLRPGEILEQILYFMRLVQTGTSPGLIQIERRPVTNVVFMGMGEPLANYDNVLQTIVMLNAKYGAGLGARQITLSTSGLVPQINRLISENLHVELAVSLHAANDTLRNRLVPINKKYPLSQLVQACREYFAKTGRRPTFEYALFQGVNDSLDQARELARLVSGLNCSVNLILGNPTSCSEFHSSSMRQALNFQKELTSNGITNTIRVSKGTDIDAGCGQLKSRWIKNDSPLSNPEIK
jgi:23S rRNA (adenine2503-C2)-methyltransferase